MRKLKLLHYLVFLVMIFTACTNQNQTQLVDMPEIGVPANEINSRLKVFAPESLNDIKIGKGVDLIVEVISSDQIAFPYNYGARLFVYENNQWQEIANLTKYPDGYLVLDPDGQPPFREGFASVDPILSDRTNPVTVRIFVVGNIFLDGQVTDQKTAAYIDVELKP